jgi:hypothetical protein
MIRFGAIVSVVVAAVALLVVGAVAGDLKLVYGSIGLAALALLLLIVGVAVWRDEVFAGSRQRGERGLASASPTGQAGRLAGSPVTVQDWQDRLAPATASPDPSAGSGQGGDTRELAVSIGALPERGAQADSPRRTGDPRPAEQLQRPGDPARGPDREAGLRERYAREAAAADRPGREAAGDWSGLAETAGDRPGQQLPPADRPAREPASARRTDRVELYPTIAGPERFEPADDPTRLAHRLDSLADIGRQYGTDPGSPASAQAGRPGGPRLPARAGTDQAGPGGQRWPGGEPVSGPPSHGQPSSKPAEPDRSSAAGADTPVAGGAVPSGSSATDLGSRGPDGPAESGSGRPEPVRPGTDGVAPASTGASPARPGTPPGADPRFATDLASAAPAAPVLATAAGSGLVDSARSASPTAADRTADRTETVVAAVADQPGAAAGAAPAIPAAAGTATTDGGSAAAPAVSPDDVVSVVPGIARYHKADCILIRFLSDEDLELTSRREAEASGCAPCRACRPDRPSAAG